MELQYSLLFLLTAFLLLILLHKKTKNPHYHLPTGPMKFPIIGNLHPLASTSSPHRTLRDLARFHGPHLMFLRLGQVNTVVASSREAAQEILKSHDLNFSYRPHLTAPEVIVYNCTDNAFSPYSAYWRQLRKLCSLHLLSPKRVKPFASLRAEETMKMMRAIASKQAGQAVNMSDLLVELTNGIVSRALFGRTTPDALKFISMLQQATSLASGFCAADLFPSLKFVDKVSGMRGKLRRIHGVLDEVLDGIIGEHQMRREGEDEEDLVDVLLKCQEQADLDVPLTLDNIKAAILVRQYKGHMYKSSMSDVPASFN